MEIGLVYQGDSLKINLPESCTVDIFSPKSDSKAMTCENFIDAYSYNKADSFFEGSSLLVVVNDAHRNTPTAKILTWLKEYRPEIFNAASFLIACGTHEPPDDEQYYKIFGDLYQSIKERVSFHNCQDYDSMTKVGTDSFGEDFWINKKIFNYDKIFIINSVEPHYFAGFTGGRKSFVPGLADFETIERNHNLANSLDCAPMKLKGNPMAEHLESILDMIDTSNVLTLQIVYDSNINIKQFCFGTIRQAFEQAVGLAEKIYACPIKEQYDVALLEILAPLDKSVYQVQKALENGQFAVKDNGAAIVVSSCSDGIGSGHFYKLADKWDKESNKPKDGKLHFGSHKLSRVNAMGKRINVFLYSTQPDEVVSKVYYNALDNIEKYIAAQAIDKTDYRIAVVHDAAHTVMTI